MCVERTKINAGKHEYEMNKNICILFVYTRVFIKKIFIIHFKRFTF